ncbi:hypothetical protein EDC04DRAFT_2605496 [Pisolithus marmoratus]|nr:hypothetical protein EDC04DRAFT_2605496 [Pisolithus marmoratus]
MSSRPDNPYWKKPYSISLKSAHSPATTKLPSILRNSLPPKELYETIPNEARSQRVRRGHHGTNRQRAKSLPQSESVSHGASPDVAVVAETTTSTGDGDAEGLQIHPRLQLRLLPRPMHWMSPRRTSGLGSGAFTWLQHQEPEAKPEQAPEATRTLPSVPILLRHLLHAVRLCTQHLKSSSTSKATTTSHGGESHSKESVSQPEDTSSSQPKLDLDNSSADVSKPPPITAQTTSLTTLQPPEVSDSTASLTSGRFTLGIPLLGRYKPPLDKATVSAQSENVQDVLKNQGETLPQETIRTVATTPIDSLPTDVPATRVESETETSNAPGDSNQVNTNNSAGTWWSYIGWNPGVSNQHSQLSSGAAGIPNQPAHPVEDVDASPSTLPATQLGTECQPAPISKSGSKDKDIPLEATNQAASYNGFAWYVPWSRYQAPSAEVQSDSNTGATSTCQQSTDQQPEPNGQEPPVPSIEGADASGPATGSINPIQSSISQNRTGWISFLSARAAAMKSITYEKEGEMEIMDIDEDISAAEGRGNSSLPGSAEAQAPSIKETRPPQLASASGRGSPATVEKTDVKQQQRTTTITTSEAGVREIVVRQSSPSPSKKSIVKTPVTPPPPNVILPTWEDIFYAPPRSIIPEVPSSSTLAKALKSVTEVLFARNEPPAEKGKGKEGKFLVPRTRRPFHARGTYLGIIVLTVLRGCQRVVVIGVHGWFPGMPRPIISEVLWRGLSLERLYQNLISNEEWMNDLREADAIFVATHSQGSILTATSGRGSNKDCTGWRYCAPAYLLLGPVRRSLRASSLPEYELLAFPYFESTAARELFELQNTESTTSKEYIRALRNVLDNGIKMVYIASLNDQVVGLYSGLFTSISHPLILRAIYIDGDAYHSSDFLSNLLALLLRIRNAGLSDSGLLTHLSEATAGSLNGIGHSTPYEELGTYTLAINYLFLANDGLEERAELMVESFNALTEQNDYEIPWALRDLIADDRVTRLFSEELVGLRDAFRNWHPKTAIQRELKRKLAAYPALVGIDDIDS